MAILKRVVLFYTVTAASIVVSCAVLPLLYGPIQMPLPQWTLITLLAISACNVPAFLRLLAETPVEPMPSGR